MAAAPAKRRRLEAPEPGLVSVCLPVHNCEDYLDECLASILGATRRSDRDSVTACPAQAPSP